MKKLFVFCLSALLLCSLLSLVACGPKYDPDAEYKIEDYFDAGTTDEGRDFLALMMSSEIPTDRCAPSIEALHDVKVTSISGTAYYDPDWAATKRFWDYIRLDSPNGIYKTKCYTLQYSWNIREKYSFDFVMTPASTANDKRDYFRIPQGVWKKGFEFWIDQSDCQLAIRNLKIDFVPV